jgi:hypothetical protein
MIAVQEQGHHVHSLRDKTSLALTTLSFYAVLKHDKQADYPGALFRVTASVANVNT